MASLSAFAKTSPTAALTQRLAAALRSKTDPPELVFRQHAALGATDLTDLITRLLTRLAQEQAPIAFSKTLLGGLKHKKSRIELAEWFDLGRLASFFREKWRTLDTALYRNFADLLEVTISQGELLNHAVDCWKRGEMRVGVSIASEFSLRHEFVTATNALETLVSENHIELAYSLVGKDSDLLEVLIASLCAHRHAKLAGKLIQKRGLDPRKFPNVLEGLKCVSVRYFLKSEQLTIPRLAELMEDDPEMMVALVEGLVKRGTLHSAASKSRPSLRLQAAYVLSRYPDVALKLPPTLVGDLRCESLPPDEVDYFQPVDPSALRYPLDRSTVKIVTDAEGIRSMDLESDVLGLDCEWRPPLLKFQWHPVSLLQIATRKGVYLLDLQFLQQSRELSAKLEAAFCSAAVKLGVNFAEDRRKLQLSYPAVSAFRGAMTNFADLQETFRTGKKGCGLGTLAETVLRTKLCKAEQRSNWQKRPLRLTQIHYAALDAFVQIMIWDQLPVPKPQLTNLL